MSELDEHELAAFESELRKFRPREVMPLVVRTSAPVIWARAVAVAAAVALVVLGIWLLRPVHQPSRNHETVFISEPLTKIRARVALARGANVDDIAPLPVKRPQAHGISALDVLAQE